MFNRIIIIVVALQVFAVLYLLNLNAKPEVNILSDKVTVPTILPTQTPTITPSPIPTPTVKVIYIEKENTELSDINETLKKQNELKEKEIRLNIVNHVYGGLGRLWDNY